MRSLIWLWAMTASVGLTMVRGEGRPPNVLLLLADDLGIGDLGCYGNTTINTPNIDRLASEGVRLTHHLAAAAMCTPSRAALLTSRYPTRYGLEHNQRVFSYVIMFTTSQARLPPDEVTLATALQAANYTTALVGKWHLGMNCNFLGRSCPGPLDYGFKSFYGIPISLFQHFRNPKGFWVFPLNGYKHQGLVVAWVVILSSLLVGYRKRMVGALAVVVMLFLSHIMLALVWFLITHIIVTTKGSFINSSWMVHRINSMIFRDDKVVERPIELDGLSQRLVQESRQFLAAHAHDDHPFFLFHSFGHTHMPMFSAEHMKGHSRHGSYGDNVEEMDESVGALLKTLKDLGLENNTLVYFASDHGGHLGVKEPGTMKVVGGYNGRFKGGKMEGGSEGGIRVPGIYRWPGRLPAGVTVDTPTSLMDFMPTVLSLAGLPRLPELVPRAVHKEIDGLDISMILMQDGKKGGKKTTEQRIFIHHCGEAIHALRLHTGEHVYKMYLYKHKWDKGSTQCRQHLFAFCKCFENVYNLTEQVHLHDLTLDPYEDLPPISPDTTEYKIVTEELLGFLQQWRARVHYPPSQISTFSNALWRFWVQP